MPLSTPHGGDARTRPLPGLQTLWLMAPAVLLVLGLFGGGLLLGVVQGAGYLPAAGLNSLTLAYFAHVVQDPDFLRSLGLTLYIASVSTLLAAILSVAMAILLTDLARHSRVAHFLFQIPLTVPHLVIAVAMLFLLAPTGLISRAAMAAGLITNSSAFPLWVNDPWCIGILATYVWKEIPFITVMVLAVLRNQGVNLTEAARTLKANRWQRLRFITLPTIFPSLGAACLIVFAYTFGAFEVPWLLGRTWPMTLPVWAYKHYADVDLLARPEGIATGMIIAVIVCLMVMVSQWITQWARRRGVIL